MSICRLDKLFEPRSVALVGASPRERSLGRMVLRKLREAGFAGPLHLVNPKHHEIDGLLCVARLEDLPQAPDLIVVKTPPATVPGIVAGAGRKGVAAAVIVTAGLGHGDGPSLLNVPTALASASEAAQAVVETIRSDRQRSFRRKPVFRLAG
jgi:acetyltransferase